MILRTAISIKISITVVFILQVIKVECLPFNKNYTTSEVQAQAVKNLLIRIIPDKVDQFEIEVNFNISNKDVFYISTRNDKVYILGNKGYTAAAGIYHYLKTYCKCHISWSGYQLNLPEYLPRPLEPKTIEFNDQFRYYQNVCTYSYSYVWWTWSRWEKEIDWMALNGINLPLAFTAQEAIMTIVFKFLNFTQDEINVFFAGPAFLAWNRMGNMQRWAGPLSENWHQIQISLQHRILDRMREFGMTPVLPAFSGRVPPAFNKHFPNASTSILSSSWSNFKPPFGDVNFLEPTDPLFNEIQSLFLQNYVEEFGTNHVYNADLFNEMPPPSNDITYLENCANAVYTSLTAFDPDAIWLIQGWMFNNDPVTWQTEQARAFLTAVPLGKMIVLDLQSEMYPQYNRLSSYFGQPFIWCMLHNYGGVTGLYGSMEQVNIGPFDGRNFEGSTMIGTGITPEGIETNDIMYELMTEMAWRKEPVNLDEWLEDFGIRRYGSYSQNITNGLILLKNSVYNAIAPFRNHGKYTLVRRPSLKIKPYIWYDVHDVFNAWNSFLSASDDAIISESQLYRHDLVDLSRQGLQIAFDVGYRFYIIFYRLKEINMTRIDAEKNLELFDDMNELLASDEHFLLGKWLYDAKNMAQTTQERRQYEFNARNQITLWGPNGEILDYANKQWAGLMTDYYKKRWILFFQVLDYCLVNNVPFNQKKFNMNVFNEVETAFNIATDVYPKTIQGDSLEISKRLYKKYRIMTETLFSSLRI